ncbi:dNMP kinase [Bacillus phage Moonbeam]|uniref:DNMP kinase n=1 Tax=Bacillus phage Moonbeam TaxID=1540091 RepID=A0A0A0RN26_9CAUD|nr:dNMP kinase [Bacillus phage Moonbeam]AIW03417.1 dNMP kinase [Bacillus phage Moonbeam]
MKKELKIALCGKIRSGKSTLEKHLVDKHEMTSFAFADKLKEEFHAKNPSVKRFPKPVSGYQTYGQGERADKYEDIWVDKCFAEIERIRKAAANYNIVGSENPFMPLVTDLRQPNEYKRLLEEGYIIIRVSAPLEVRKERAAAKGDNISDENFEFDTENHVDTFDVDYDIMNDGTLEELLWEMDMVMATIQEKRKLSIL